MYVLSVVTGKQNHLKLFDSETVAQRYLIKYMLDNFFDGDDINVGYVNRHDYDNWQTCELYISRIREACKDSSYENLYFKIRQLEIEYED